MTIPKNLEKAMENKAEESGELYEILESSLNNSHYSSEYDEKLGRVENALSFLSSAICRQLTGYHHASDMYDTGHKEFDKNYNQIEGKDLDDCQNQVRETLEEKITEASFEDLSEMDEVIEAIQDINPKFSKEEIIIFFKHSKRAKEYMINESTRYTG